MRDGVPPDEPRVIGRLLRAVDAAPPYSVLDVVRGEIASEVAVHDVDLLLADYSATSLQRLGGGEAAQSGDVVTIEGTLAGQAFATQEVLTGGPDAPTVVYAPVTAQGQRQGVLEAVLARPADDEAMAYLADVALAVAYLVSVSERLTDLFAVLRRRRRMDLAAEMQWQLLPTLSQESPRFSLAGWLEPAYEVGGDIFDFVSDPDRVWISVTDGVGHGVGSAMLTSLAVGTLRNQRRHGGGLAEQAAATDRELALHGGPDMFVTGVLLQLELTTGKGKVVNAGHPRIRRLRSGAIELLEIPPDLPFGLYGDVDYREHPIEVVPGDRLILLSDGIIEATAAPDVEPFGASRLNELLIELEHAHPRQVVREVTSAVGELLHGQLRDDATVVCLDWRG